MRDQRKPIDVSKMLIVEARNTPKGWTKGTWREEYLARVSETEDRITQHFVIVTRYEDYDSDATPRPLVTYYARRSTTAQKFLCVGGPHGGKKLVEQKDYVCFNRADYYSSKSPRRSKIKVVQVWKELL